MTEFESPNHQLLDVPLKDPDNDLLGMSHYAAKLAEFIMQIDPPFTIGIYGEWGSGKTSFVNFTQVFLTRILSPSQKDLLFVRFSAWPYTTADELWRALILDIAKALYGVDATQVKSDPPEKKAQPIGILEWLSVCLMQDAIVLREPQQPVDPLAEYKTLLQKLDAASYNSISKNPQAHMQLDQEVAMRALAQTAVAVLSSMSPLVASARALLGLNKNIDVSSLIQREKNETARKQIEGLQNFRTLFKDLFAAKAQGKRVCVFIDDLDRCMPDVALDILEAIKVILGDVPCVFLVAADERLIGQGLRLRYREMLDQTSEENVHSFFSHKGQEYFEKIIQLSIRVPARSEAQTHSYITAQFPEWMAVTDIVTTVLGDNPRRIKQYCNWLRYKYLVSQKQGDRT